MAAATRYSLNAVQDYAHTAGLFVARWNPEGGAYRFRVFDEEKPYLDEDWLFETTALGEVAAFVRGYRKALAKYLREHKQNNGSKEQKQPEAKKAAPAPKHQKAAKQQRASHAA